VKKKSRKPRVRKARHTSDLHINGVVRGRFVEHPSHGVVLEVEHHSKVYPIALASGVRSEDLKPFGILRLVSIEDAQAASKKRPRLTVRPGAPIVATTSADPPAKEPKMPPRIVHRPRYLRDPLPEEIRAWER
jgi:hypothetical protein